MPAFVQQVTPPAPAAPPTPPSAPGPYIVNSGSLPGGAPMTRQDVIALQARRSELNGQLESASRTRRQLSEQLRRTSSDVDRAGLESRLATLDTRIARIEGQLDEVSQQLASQPAARVAGTQDPFAFGARGPRFNSMNPEPIIITFTLFVLCPIALSISRLIWKRGSRTALAPVALESTQRLERMEQAMDAIAIEIERVSEGQRFVTRLLSERGPNMLGAAQQPAEPVRVPLGNASPTR